MPNRPKISGGWSLKGILSQFPLGLETIPLNLSNSLSHEMHFSCFLVKSASFSFYSSQEITKMISFIFAYRNSNAFFTYSLSLFRQMRSLIWLIFSSICCRYLSYQVCPTLVSNFDLISFKLVNTSVCSVLSFSSSLETLFSLITEVRSLMFLIFSQSFLQLKLSLSSKVSSLAHSLTIQGLISLILSLMPSVVFYLLASVFLCPPLRLSTFRFQVISLIWTQKCFILSPHFQNMVSMLLSIKPQPAIPLRLRELRFISSTAILGLLLATSSQIYLDYLLLQKLLMLVPLLDSFITPLTEIVLLLKLPLWPVALPMGVLLLPLISFLTFSSISFIISISFLACKRSAFSLSISIFYIL